MSTNCIQCVKNQRTGIDLLCDTCRARITEIKSRVGVVGFKAEPYCYANVGEPEEEYIVTANGIMVGQPLDKATAPKVAAWAASAWADLIDANHDALAKDGAA